MNQHEPGFLDVGAAQILSAIDAIYAAADDNAAWPRLVDCLLDVLHAAGDTPCADAALASRLAPHLARAVQQQTLMLGQRDMIRFQRMLLDEHHLPIALCGADATVLWANAGMRPYLQALPASALAQLTAPDTVRPAVHALPLRQLAVKLVALSVPPVGSGQVVLFASTAQPIRLDAGLLKRLFGLTAAESKVAQALAEGLAPDAIGEQNGTSPHTVRSHLKQVMSKTGTCRQSELLARLFASPANMHFPAAAADARASGARLLIGRRALGYREYGPRDGRPVLFMQGWGGSDVYPPPDARPLFAHGIRLVMPDRPGSGASDPHEAAGLGDWPRDVARLADQLGIGRFAVLAYSLGAMYGLACAHAMPARVSGLTLIAPLAPLGGLAELDGMLPLGRLLLGLALRLPELTAPLLRLWIASVRRDRRLYFDTIAPYLDDSGVAGRFALRVPFMGRWPDGPSRLESTLVREVKLAASAWAGVAAVGQPVTLWHAEQDRHTSIMHSERLLALLPQARLERVPAGGHYLLRHCWQRILASIT